MSFIYFVKLKVFLSDLILLLSFISIKPPIKKDNIIIIEKMITTGIDKMTIIFAFILMLDINKEILCQLLNLENGKNN